MPRPGTDREQVDGAIGAAIWLDMPALPVSGTLIRQRFAAGSGVRFLVTDGVYDTWSQITSTRMPSGRTGPQHLTGGDHDAAVGYEWHTLIFEIGHQRWALGTGLQPDVLITQRLRFAGDIQADPGWNHHVDDVGALRESGQIGMALVTVDVRPMGVHGHHFVTESLEVPVDASPRICQGCPWPRPPQR